MDSCRCYKGLVHFFEKSRRPLDVRAKVASLFILEAYGYTWSYQEKYSLVLEQYAS